MNRLERLGRREFTIGATATVARYLFPPADYLYPIDKNPNNEKEPKTFGIFGLHDTANVGGSIIPDLTVADLLTLGAKYLVSLDPSERLIEKANSARITVICRAYLDRNKFDQQQLTKTMVKLRRHIDSPFIQPFNEVNLKNETGDIPLSPQDHVKQDFLKAADHIVLLGGRVLLTPLAQNAPVDELVYLSQMLQELKIHKSLSWIEKYINVAVHNYTFAEDENPWLRIQRINAIIKKELGMHLPIHITEAGVHQAEKKQVHEKTVIKETMKLLDSPIPAHLPVASYCLWLLANYAQRPDNHQIEPKAELKDFELSALRGIYGPKPVYRAIENFAQAQVQSKDTPKTLYVNTQTPLGLRD